MMDLEMDMHNHSMQRFFHFGDYDVTVLFKNWNINSVGALIGSFIGIFVMSMLYEGLKVFREVLEHNKVKLCGRKCGNSIRYKSANANTNADMEPLTYGSIKRRPQVTVTASLGLHVTQTLLHMIQVTISYFLMLIVMTYNAWLFIAVVLGAGTGYFLFAKFRRPIKNVIQDLNEHCH